MTLETLLWIIFWVWLVVGVLVFFAYLRNEGFGGALIRGVFWPFRFLGEIVDGVLD